MTDNQLKALSAAGLFIGWAALLFAKLKWPHLEVGQIIFAIQSTLVGLGIYHMK